MTEFQRWIVAQVNRYAQGNKREFARMLGIRDSAVHAWMVGRNKLSRRSCLLLAQLPGIGLTAQEIAQLADAKWVFGRGNGERDKDVRLPSRSKPKLTLKTIVTDPVYPSCDGCSEYKYGEAYSDRARYYCTPLALAGLPVLCEAHSIMDEMIITLMLENTNG